MKVFSSLMLTAALAGAAAVASAQTTLYTTDFETSQAANFTVSTTSADTEADLSYNYSTWAPTAPTDGITSIPAAPTAAGTTGLKMRANFDGTGTTEGVSAYVTAAAADLANKTQYTITFDAFQLWNGPAGSNPPSGTGTTTMMTVGFAVPGVAATTTANLNGSFFVITPEGGTTADVRYYFGTGAAAVTNDNAVPNWFNTNKTASSDAEWIAAFPGNSTSNSPVPGTPGRQWVTWTIVRNGSSLVVSAEPAGGSETQLAAFNATIPAGAVPFIGFTDPFTGSIADPASDNFVVVDNLTVTEPGPEPTHAEIWSVYN